VTIRVSAAISTTEPLTALAKAYEAKHPHVKVQLNFGATSTLARQIEDGAPVDLFLSASQQWAEALKKKDLIDQEIPLVGNKLVVIIPADSDRVIKSAEDLVQEDQKRLAIADPSGVPAGVYAKKALERAQLWDKVSGKLVTGGDVRETLALVETGAAGIGIVYATDVVVSDSVKVVWEFPTEDSADIVYPWLNLKQQAPANALATVDEFYGFVHSPEGLAEFSKAGFRSLK